MNIIDRLSWATSHKDQAGITKDLAEGKDISEVYGVGEAGLFDEFFYFLQRFQILDLFFALDPNISKRKSNVQFPTVILIYLMRVVAILAKHGFFPKRIHALLNSTEIQSTERCPGCGKVKKEKAPELRLRKGRIRKVMETVFGFKVWLLWDPNSRLPPAIRFDTIEVSDVTYTREIITQAVSNLGTHDQRQLKFPAPESLHPAAS
jgi:hypothetical protein